MSEKGEDGVCWRDEGGCGSLSLPIANLQQCYWTHGMWVHSLVDPGMGTELHLHSNNGEKESTICIGIKAKGIIG